MRRARRGRISIGRSRSQYWRMAAGACARILLLDLLLAEQLFRRGDVGHRDLMVETRLLDLEGGRQRENRLAVLDGDDPAGGEARSVANAVHLDR